MFEQEQVSDKPISDRLQTVFLTAFTFLSALLIRDTFTLAVKRSVDEKLADSVTFSLLLTLISLIIMVSIVLIMYYT